MAADERDTHRDPITSEPGSHPLGTGVGAAGGAVAGAAAGTIAGPLGSLVGGVVGAVVGGLAGKAAAEAINPTAEEAHWRDNYSRESYVEPGRSFDDYGPAYRHGVEGRLQHEGDWEAAEPELASRWEQARGGSSLSWDQARPASQAAWDRVETRRRSMDTGTAGAVGAMQSAGDDSGSHGDVVDTLQDLVECSKDGEYGFRQCAEQASRADLKSRFLQRADDCRRAAEELNDRIRDLGGTVETGGSALGAVHRGWVSVRSTLSMHDDLAVLEEAERGEDNALARYRKALKASLPVNLQSLVERQQQGVQRGHDEVKRLRDEERQRRQGGSLGGAAETDSNRPDASHTLGSPAASGSSSSMGASHWSGGAAAPLPADSQSHAARIEQLATGDPGTRMQTGTGTATGVAGSVGTMQSAGHASGDRSDVIDVLQDLVEVCKDGEYGFRESAKQVSRQDLQALFTQRADDCRSGAEALNHHITRLGGTVETGGSAMGAVHRGWVSVRSALSTRDDYAVLEECERGEDNALARYRKALAKPLPVDVKAVVERQLQGVQRNHDQIKMLRDSTARS